MSAYRVVGSLVAAAVLGVAVWSLRDATMSVHTRQAPDSRLEVVVESEVWGRDDASTLAAYTHIKVAMCRTEVADTDLVVDLEPVDDEHERLFRFVLQPSLDATDRKQFRGCLHDWNLDRVEVEVVSMTDLGP